MSTQPTQKQLHTQFARALTSATGAAPEPKDIKLMLSTLASAVAACIQAHGAAILPGIGKLQVQAQPERMARHPLTGNKLKVPAKKSLKFAAADALKQSL